MSTLETTALTVNLSLGEHNPCMKNKAVQQATANTFQADVNQIGGVIYLIKQDYTRDIKKKIRSIRDFFDLRTFKVGGTRFISSAAFWPLTEYMRETTPEFEALRDEFIAKWRSEIVPQSIAALGNVPFDQKHFNLTEDQLRAKIRFDFSKDLISGPNAIHQLEGLHDDIRAQMVEEMQEKHAAIEEATKEQARERVAKVLAAFEKKMRTFDQDKSRIHDSLLGNISEMVEIIPTIVIGEDDELLDALPDVQALTAWDKDVLKDNPDARRQAQTKAKEILTRLVGEQPEPEPAPISVSATPSTGPTPCSTEGCLNLANPGTGLCAECELLPVPEADPDQYVEPESTDVREQGAGAAKSTTSILESMNLSYNIT